MDASTAESLLVFAEEAAPALRGPDAKRTHDAVDERYADLLAATAWFVDEGRTDDALRLATALYPYWITTQRFADGATWFDRVLASPGGDDRRRGNATLQSAFMPFWMGDNDRAGAGFAQGLAIGRALGDVGLTARGLTGLARVALRSDIAEARRLAAEALDVSETGGDQAGISDSLHLLGVSAQVDGDLVAARQWMTRRLALVREQRNDPMIASEAANLSMVERQLGNLDEAEALVRESLEVGERAGDQFTRPFALAGFGAIATERGAYDRAARLVGAAEAILEAQDMAWPPDERPHYEHMLAVLPDAMGTAAFDEARAAGRVMTPSEAVAFALGSRSPPIST
jgi:tetratricopeptide (TPR) repeat protein